LNIIKKLNKSLNLIFNIKRQYLIIIKFRYRNILIALVVTPPTLNI
jgi:hypothetical protein